MKETGTSSNPKGSSAVPVWAIAVAAGVGGLIIILLLVFMAIRIKTMPKADKPGVQLAPLNSLELGDYAKSYSPMHSEVKPIKFLSRCRIVNTRLSPGISQLHPITEDFHHPLKPANRDHLIWTFGGSQTQI